MRERKNILWFVLFSFGMNRFVLLFDFGCIKTFLKVNKLIKKILAKLQNWSLTFRFFHFSPLTFNYCQFGTLLNSSYVLLLIEPKWRHFSSLFFFLFSFFFFRFLPKFIEIFSKIKNNKIKVKTQSFTSSSLPPFALTSFSCALFAEDFFFFFFFFQIQNYEPKTIRC